MPHGIRQVLSEKMVYGRTGHLQNANLLQYQIPSVHEMPHVTPIIVESSPSEGPFGAKEAGEGPLPQFFLRSLTQFTMP